MGSKKPVRWLAQRAAAGIKELPSNIAWVISRALPRPVEKVAGQAKDSTRRMSAAVKDAVPAGSDLVETRLKRAREATDRAQHVEEEARTRIADATAQMAQARRLADEAEAAQQRADALSAAAQRRAGASTNGGRRGREGAAEGCSYRGEDEPTGSALCR